tara:strand:+ start:583 stop:1323 length:741 start_codon:yes stop_codon:yes gene_type:complete
MTDAYENGNPQPEGQTIDNVGQDEGQNVEENSNQTWEEQAKYFQSEKDKLANENQNLKKYEAIGNLLKARPDIANTVATMVQGGNNGQPVGPQRIELDKDEFDPWEAYNDPKSKSYKFRQQELQDSIGQAVNQRMAGVMKQQGVQQLKGNLLQQGLTPAEVDSFMSFAAKNPSEYGVEGAVKMWRAVMNEGQGTVAADNPLDNVRQTQETPTPGGILQGQQPPATSGKDDMWDSIVSAGSRTNVLK